MHRQRYQYKARMAFAIGGLLVFAVLPAFAQQADMTVKGTIVPGACSTSFEGSARDFGSISVADLPADSYYALGALTGLIMDVLCPASRHVSFSIVDEQAGTAIADTDMYRALNPAGGVDATNVRGLGTAMINGTPVSLGSYIITAGPPVVGSTAEEGGSTRTVLRSTDDGATWREVPAFGTRVYPILGADLYTAGNEAEVPTAGVRHVFPMEIRGALNRGALLQATEAVQLDGRASFVIRYE